MVLSGSELDLAGQHWTWLVFAVQDWGGALPFFIPLEIRTCHWAIVRLWLGDGWAMAGRWLGDGRNFTM